MERMSKGFFSRRSFPSEIECQHACRQASLPTFQDISLPHVMQSRSLYFLVFRARRGPRISFVVNYTIPFPVSVHVTKVVHTQSLEKVRLPVKYVCHSALILWLRTQ